MAGVTSLESGKDEAPLNTSYVGYWKNYRRHLAPLIEALGEYADVETAAS